MIQVKDTRFNGITYINDVYDTEYKILEISTGALYNAPNENNCITIAVDKMKDITESKEKVEPIKNKPINGGEQ